MKKRVLQVETVLGPGQFGNRMLAYLLARQIADVHGAELRVRPWIGECFFQLDDARVTEPVGRPITDREIIFGWKGVVAMRPFFKIPERIVLHHMTRANARRIFKWQSNWGDLTSTRLNVAFHRRTKWDDGVWPKISEDWARRISEQQGFDGDEIDIISDDSPRPAKGCWPFEFMMDFVLMVKAKHLFVHPVSTFSGMAALLGDGNVYTIRKTKRAWKSWKHDNQKPLRMHK